MVKDLIPDAGFPHFGAPFLGVPIVKIIVYWGP